jgi:hypothetical protein
MYLFVTLEEDVVAAESFVILAVVAVEEVNALA